MMLQLVMDRINKCYQVLIVSKDRSGGPVAEVFHSNTGAWTTTNLSHLKYGSGHRYAWNDHCQPLYTEGIVAPCVYDCAEGQFLEITGVGDRLTNNGYTLKHYALVQDRLFILRQKGQEAIEGSEYLEAEYYIAEFQAAESGAKWLKLKDHRCSDLGYSALSLTSYTLSACKGFLLVVTYVGSAYAHGLERLYDLSTGKWHALSRGFQEISSYFNLMCELHWDSIP